MTDKGKKGQKPHPYYWLKSRGFKRSCKRVRSFSAGWVYNIKKLSAPEVLFRTASGDPVEMTKDAAVAVKALAPVNYHRSQWAWLYVLGPEGEILNSDTGEPVYVLAGAIDFSSGGITVATAASALDCFEDGMLPPMPDDGLIKKIKGMVRKTKAGSRARGRAKARADGIPTEKYGRGKTASGGAIVECLTGLRTKHSMLLEMEAPEE